MFAIFNINIKNCKIHVYKKELQFRALEKSSQQDERCSVLRNGVIDRINPIDLVVGDIIILQVLLLFLYYFASFVLFSSLLLLYESI